MRKRATSLVSVVLIALQISALGAVSATESVAEPGWLTRINAYRATAGVTPLTEQADLSQGALDHSRYVVETDNVTPFEDTSSEWYSKQGDYIAAGSQTAVFHRTGLTDDEIVDFWMTSAFQSILSLTPTLLKTGYGVYADESSPLIKTAATLYLGGVTGDRTYLQYPIMYPGPGSTIGVVQGNPSQRPNPLTACPGYEHPVGLPISIQVREAGALTASSLKRDDVEVEHCVFDAATYTNPNEEDQVRARQVLSVSQAAVIIPREPFVVGSTYTASVSIGGVDYTWSFAVGETTVWSDQIVLGSQEADSLSGSDAEDVSYALGGDDSIATGGGADRIYAGLGNDVLTGGDLSDLVNGEAGNDRVAGGTGNDFLYGRSGADRLIGGTGFDKFDAGSGNDLCVIDSERERRQATGCERFKKAH